MACRGAPRGRQDQPQRQPVLRPSAPAHQALACRWACESTAHAGASCWPRPGPGPPAGWCGPRRRPPTAAGAPTCCAGAGRVRVALEIQLARSGRPGGPAAARNATAKQGSAPRGSCQPRSARRRPASCRPSRSPSADGIQLGRRPLRAGLARPGTGHLLSLDRFVTLLLRGAVRLRGAAGPRRLACAVAVTAPDTCRRCGGAFEHLVGRQFRPRPAPRYHVGGVPLTCCRTSWRCCRPPAGTDAGPAWCRVGAASAIRGLPCSRHGTAARGRSATCWPAARLAAPGRGTAGGPVC